jgi:hypothetical protein
MTATSDTLETLLEKMHLLEKEILGKVHEKEEFSTRFTRGKSALPRRRGHDTGCWSRSSLPTSGTHVS